MHSENMKNIKNLIVPVALALGLSSCVPMVAYELGRHDGERRNRVTYVNTSVQRSYPEGKEPKQGVFPPKCTVWLNNDPDDFTMIPEHGSATFNEDGTYKEVILDEGYEWVDLEKTLCARKIK